MTPGVLLPYLKAVVAFVAPGAVVIGAAVREDSLGGTAITSAEWVTAAVACIVTAYGVLRVPNAPNRTQLRRQLLAAGYTPQAAERTLAHVAGDHGTGHGRKRRRHGRRSLVQLLRDITWGG